MIKCFSCQNCFTRCLCKLHYTAYVNTCKKFLRIIQVVYVDLHVPKRKMIYLYIIYNNSVQCCYNWPSLSSSRSTCFFLILIKGSSENCPFEFFGYSTESIELWAGMKWLSMHIQHNNKNITCQGVEAKGQTDTHVAAVFLYFLQPLWNYQLYCYLQILK